MDKCTKWCNGNISCRQWSSLTHGQPDAYEGLEKVDHNSHVHLCKFCVDQPDVHIKPCDDKLGYLASVQTDSELDSCN